MPHVDTNAPLVTNSDAAMWRRDHDTACRYIEVLLAERETWAGVMGAARRLVQARKRLDATTSGTYEFEAARGAVLDAQFSLIDLAIAALKEV